MFPNQSHFHSSGRHRRSSINRFNSKIGGCLWPSLSGIGKTTDVKFPYRRVTRRSRYINVRTRVKSITWFFPSSLRIVRHTQPILFIIRKDRRTWKSPSVKLPLTSVGSLYHNTMTFGTVSKQSRVSRSQTYFKVHGTQDVKSVRERLLCTVGEWVEGFRSKRILTGSTLL